MTRFFDILLSGIAIVILLPFMLPIMIGLKLTGEHDIFYGQTRIGKGGKEFKVLKFATMLRNSPNMAGGLYTTRDDPRILPMGKFLRKTKINELPQLINIFIGQMSIVGYRPTVKAHYMAYPEWCRDQFKNARPGLTGLASIAFRDEENILSSMQDPDSFHQNIIQPYKGQLESWYIDHKNIFLYFKIIFMTAEAVIHPNSRKWHTAFKGLPEIPAELKQYI